MIGLEKQKVKFIKAMYGKEHFENQDKVQFGDTWIVGWYLLGYPTLKDFESEFTDRDMLDIHKQLTGEIRREPDMRFMDVPDLRKKRVSDENY